MKSTKKFLCYSLALVGAALIFSVGCKKTTTNTYPVYSTQIPTLANPSPLAIGTTFSAAAADDAVALMGASSITSIGFNVYAWGVTTTTNPVTLTWGTAASPMQITATVPTGYLGTGAFNASLSTTASYGALSPVLTAAGSSGVVTWVVQSFATNANGTVVSLTPTVFSTTN